MLTVQKNDVTQNFQWITKSKAYTLSSKDIVLTISKEGTAKNGTHRAARGCVYFHNKSGERISKTGYVMFGIDGNRLYFCEADKISGFKLTVQNSENCCAQATDKMLVDWISKHIGEYSLNQDSKSGLYYVEDIKQ